MQGDQRIAGRYRLLGRAGTGGMGVVWRARDERLDRVVALKQARRSDAVSGRTLRREARLAAGLRHPNVVAFHEVVTEGDELWIVMEYVPSRSLAEVLAAEGPLPARTVAGIGVQVAAALAAVHERGIVHRDVKPGNVLITDEGLAKLTDFGLSRSVRADETITDSPLIGGTPGYLAPEVAQGHPPTAASDVFSLGATLFSAVEGTPPFGGGNEYATIRKAAEGPVPQARNAGVLASVLSALMAFAPAERPTASVARELLAGGLEGLPSAPSPRRRPGPRLRRAVVAGAVPVVVVVLAAAFLLFARTRDTPAPPAVPVKPAVLGIGGNPVEADPCRLVDATPLKAFGPAAVDPDYGNFDRCDVIIPRGAGRDGEERQADVKVELLDPSGDGAPAGRRTRSGPFAVFGDPAQDGACTRLVQLQDRYLVRIEVEDDQGDDLDVCRVADLAVASATEVLAAAGVPTRSTPYPAASLARLNACALLDPAGLAGAAGVTAPVRVRPGFGHWSCDWDSDTVTRAVTVMFDRDQPPGPDSGRLARVAGREVHTSIDDFAPETCQALLVYRQYTDAQGEAAVEQIKVVVHGDPPSSRLCTPATALAGDVVAKLPKP
ncbi:serine/threonine-protein kinase [Amycolatopsis sp. PS_44_ISF1]|uniref:serine/threonine-protein kinase n=1 Tax=Amycolatopsis sp. PS_44_ISF1 TaxID=2974917 RepID=UPI0028DDD780|nr:serine/threonine-protein kinase [Amycolatopsis sp. PS_44_ISF1]MDT8912485.1 serine/threonine protein kinase [Amycolatopsis sp. PS_44_ISF1]